MGAFLRGCASWKERRRRTSKSTGTHIDNVDEWISAINNYLTAGLNDFEQRPNWNASRTSRGGESLMALQNRDAMYGRRSFCSF